MDKVLEQRENALKSLRAADYMLSHTFPVFNDSKMLVNVLEDLFLCANATMSAFLLHKRKTHEVEPFHENFDSKLNIFEEYAKEHNLSKHVPYLKDLKSFMAFHKESPVEFRKNEKFVMCSEEYKNIEKLTPELLKSLFSKAKLFIEEVFYLIDNPEVNK